MSGISQGQFYCQIALFLQKCFIFLLLCNFLWLRAALFECYSVKLWESDSLPPLVTAFECCSHLYSDFSKRILQSLCSLLGVVTKVSVICSGCDMRDLLKCLEQHPPPPLEKGGGCSLRSKQKQPLLFSRVWRARFPLPTPAVGLSDKEW